MNEFDLTEDEKQFAAASSRVPEEIKKFMAHQKDNVGVEISYYRKVAMRAKTRADALLSVRMLAEVEGEMADLAEARKRVIISERNERQAAEVIEAQSKELERLRALPSMAVFSED